MKDIINEIINKIPSGAIFDTHTIIEYLLQNNSDEYLLESKNRTTEQYHGYIGRTIDSFNERLIEQKGKSWSKNIHDNFTECTCWQKR